LERGVTGDREKKVGKLSQYIAESVTNREIIAPTFTTYIHPDVKTSLLADDIEVNIAGRNKAKKEMFVAKAQNNHLRESFKKVEQTQRKRSNNAVSGALVTASTPLFNKTGHSTLTSICRSTSGYGNANNEKLLTGNRHYYNYAVVVNNITSIIGHTDYDQFKLMMDKYQLTYPSTQQVMACITYSTSLYWRSEKHTAKIEGYVNRLSALQKAAFVYTGDLYQVLKLNDGFVRGFLTQLSLKVYGTCENPKAILKAASDSTLNLAHQICTAETKGIGKDYSSIENSEKIHTLACTVQNIDATVWKYTDFIRAIMVTSNLPASMSHFPDSIRRSAVTSDTDSTIFTVQDWVIWYIGKLSFSEKAIAIQAAMTFIASSAIIHILATMSANLGVSKKHLFRIDMKSEFRFDVFVPTQIGKTYFAAIGCQEGNVFSEHEIEIKGVQLKSSNVPAILNKKAKAMMIEIMDTVVAEKKISVTSWLKHVADIERDIMASIKKGEVTYLRLGSIKDAASYSKSPEDSPYRNHDFWNETMGQSLGYMPKPPYQTAKVSLTIENQTDLENWLNSISDKSMAERFRSSLAKQHRTNLSTLHVPMEMLQRHGIPEVFLPVVDFRKIAGELCKSFYLILETLGVYLVSDKMKRMASDLY
jgi:hypothetical protein